VKLSGLEVFAAVADTGSIAAGAAGYLYGGGPGVIAFPIVRKTARRIYYARTAPGAGTGFVARRQLERDGRVHNRGRRTWDADYLLYATREAAEEALSATTPTEGTTR
jgi:hypothetical protein